MSDLKLLAASRCRVVGVAGDMPLRERIPGVNYNDRMFVTGHNGHALQVTCPQLVQGTDILMVDGFIVEVETVDPEGCRLWLTHECPHEVRAGAEIFPVMTARWNPHGDIDSQAAAEAAGRWDKVLAVMEGR